MHMVKRTNHLLFWLFPLSLKVCRWLLFSKFEEKIWVSRDVLSVGRGSVGPGCRGQWCKDPTRQAKWFAFILLNLTSPSPCLLPSLIFMFLVRTQESIQDIQHMFQGPRGLLCGTRHSQDQLSNKEGRKYSCSWNKSVSQARRLQPIKGQQATGMSCYEWSFGSTELEGVKQPSIFASWFPIRRLVEGEDFANDGPGGVPVTFLIWILLDEFLPCPPTPCELFRPSDRLVLWLGGGPQLLNLHEWEELELCMNQGTSWKRGWGDAEKQWCFKKQNLTRCLTTQMSQLEITFQVNFQQRITFWWID